MNTESVKLCDVCTSQIFHRTLRTGYLVPFSLLHHPSFEALKHSSRQCLLCARLYQMRRDTPMHSMELFVISSAFPEVVVDVEHTSYYDFPAYRLKFSTPDPLHNRKEIWDSALWSGRSQVNLDDRLPFIRDSLSRCTRNHQECKTDRKSTLPSRLLDLMTIGEACCRLIESSRLDSSDTRYTTLSYRWGGGNVTPPKTLRANLHERCRAITADELPRTFADAIMITRKLGVRYIWIDSLCIIQDSDDDWRQEATRMCDVYSGSYLNIAAMDATDVNGGCFLDLERPSLRICLDEAGVDFRIRDSHLLYGDVIEKSTLLSRGWVFQELLLAPRILYCGKRQFSWHCSQDSRSEDGLTTLNIISTQTDRRTSTYLTSLGGIGAVDTWAQLMQRYTACDLTFHGDRLPAMAGITQRFKNLYQLRPILGLWQEAFGACLAWYFKPPPRHEPRHDLPSWTWLSHAHTEIIFDICQGGWGNFRPASCVNVRHFESRWTGQDLVSTFISARLTVRGFLIDVQLHILDPFLGMSRVLDVDARLSTRMRATLTDDANAPIIKVDDKRHASRFATPTWTKMLLLLIRDNSGAFHIDMLLLEPVPTHGSSACERYKRLGLAKWWIGSTGASADLADTSILALWAEYWRVHIDDLPEKDPPMAALQRILQIQPQDVELV